MVQRDADVVAANPDCDWCGRLGGGVVAGDFSCVGKFLGLLGQLREAQFNADTVIVECGVWWW